MNYYDTVLNVELEDRIVEIPIRVNYIFRRNYERYYECEGYVDINIISIDVYYGKENFTKDEIDTIMEQVDLAEKSDQLLSEIENDEKYDYDYISEKL